MGGSSDQQIAQIAAEGAAATGTILSTLAAPSIAAISPAFAAAGPIGLAVAGLITVAFLIKGAFQGCGQTCVAATQIADQVQTYLVQNLNTYLAAPVHYRSLQLGALNNFDTALAAMNKMCSDPQLGDAGRRCISDRQQGACAIHAAYAGGWEGTTYKPWGPSASAGPCWNYYVGYRDPIANDPTVVPDPSPLSTTSLETQGASLLSSIGVNPKTTVFGIPVSGLLLPAALLGAALLIPSGSKGKGR